LVGGSNPLGPVEVEMVIGTPWSVTWSTKLPGPTMDCFLHHEKAFFEIRGIVWLILTLEI